MIGLHVSVEFPGIVRNLDVDRWQTVIVPPGVAASVHAHLSRMSGLLPSSMGQPWRPVTGNLAAGSPHSIPVPSPARPGATCWLPAFPAGCAGHAPSPASVTFRSVNWLLDLRVCHNGRLV